MKKSELFIAFFAGFAVTVSAYTIEGTRKASPLNPEMIKLCQHGNFHPSCDSHRSSDVSRLQQ